MTDVLTRKQRKYCMSRIRGKDTAPEIAVRRLVHRLGYRFRLHKRELPGCPDIVLPRHKKVIFVHGCFWHMHRCRYGRVRPKTNKRFWEKKRTGNVGRTRKDIRALRRLGWKVLVIWECQTRDTKSLYSRLKAFLKS
jgi:DNA mismatch endonuclease (patch repair protein)